MRILGSAILFLLPALVFAQAPPPPPLPASSKAVPYVAPRPAAAEDEDDDEGAPPPPPAIQYVPARPVEQTPVAPPPPPLPVARPAPIAPASPPRPASALPFVEAREVGAPPSPVTAPPVPAEPAPRTITVIVAPPAPVVAAPAAPAPASEIGAASPASPQAAPSSPVEELGEAAPAPPVQAATAKSSPPEAAAKPGEEAEAAEEDDFIKGELSSVGVSRMVARNNHVLVSGGYNRIGKAHYVLVYPRVGLAAGDFSLGIGAPLNFEVFDAAYPREPGPGENHVIGVANAGSLRKQDWDEVADFARVLTYLTYGHKEDAVYLDIGQRHASTIGHGTIMRRYASNIDVNLTRVGAQFDAHNDYLGMELMTNDVMRWGIVGGLAFVKPLAILGASSQVARSLSIGATAVVDRDAPVSLQMMPEPACPAPGACAPANVPAVDDNNRLTAHGSPVTVAGIDLELKLLRTSHADLKPYLDYSKLLYSGAEGSGGGGLTLGLLARLNAGVVLTHAFRFVAEVRMLGRGYRPSYFDSFYEVDKYLEGATGGVEPGDGGVPRTRLQATVGDGGMPERTGYYFEASYGVRDAIGLTLAIEGQSKLPEKNFIAHLEVPALSFLQFFASLYKRGFTEMATLVDLDDHAVAFAGVRLKVLPILFVSARAFKTFELDAYKSAYGPLGTLQYKNVSGYTGDVELGFEF